MKHKRNWIIGIALSATAAFVALQTVNAPSQETIPISETPTTAFEGCSYTWAYQDVPELTEKLNTAVQEINPDASATATAFGEDCIFADGSSTFGAMETDFLVRFPVDDLTTHEEFGNWMKEVLQIVTAIPREEIPGPNYGFVDFSFDKSDSEKILTRVSIQEYLDDAKEKSGVELFDFFYKQ